jgi:2-polyprenyl-3-methyl-5-hydroxy-6-metoxy-1,4-benzoquinol methylase
MFSFVAIVALEGQWLDVGYGTGRLTKLLASLDCAVHGVDASAEMIHGARCLAKQYHASVIDELR